MPRGQSGSGFHMLRPSTIFLCALILAVASAFSSNRLFLFGVFTTALAVAAVARVSVARFLLFSCGATALLVGPLAALAAVFVSSARGELLLMRAFASASILSITAHTPGFRGIISGLSALRLPQSMISILVITYAQLKVISRIAQSMVFARQARVIVRQPWTGTVAALGVNGAVLFRKSLQQSDELHRAMLARGFSGTMPRANTHTWAAGEAVLVLAITGVAGWGILA